MMRFYNFVSIIIHPIVLPTISVLLYFMFLPVFFEDNQKFVVVGLTFTITFVLPVLILLILKWFNLINSFKVKNIDERKLPLLIMVLLFYILGNAFTNIVSLFDIVLLFYATSISLLITYFLFLFNFKTSIHLLSLGVTTSFFLTINSYYKYNFIVIVLICIILSGILGSARLHLKAHTAKEVYFGYILGFLCLFIVNYFYKM